MEWPRHDKLGDHLTQLRSSATADPVFAEALAAAPAFLVQRSPASRLDLSNSVAKTEYHSRLVLSTLILQFFRKKGVPAGVLAFFLYSAQRKPLALAENPLVFYCFLQWFLLL